MSDRIAIIESLLLGRVQTVAETGSGEWWDKSWSTSFLKSPQNDPCWLGYEGFRDDEQADRRYHGGVDKAVCVYPAAHYPDWRDALGLPDFPHGAFGENLTIAGLDENTVSVGDTFAIGDARVQVSQPRQPCWKLARRWHIKDLTAQVERNGRTGWYFRVLQHGWVRPGDALIRLEQAFPEWTIQRCNDLMHGGDTDAARRLSECPLLSGSWRDDLWARVDRS